MKKLFISILLTVGTFGYCGPFHNIPEEFQRTCQRIQLEFGIPDGLLYAVPMKESSWNPNTPPSHAACIGLMQLNPKYSDYFVEAYWTYPEEFNIDNPYHNLWMGFCYLSDLKKRFGTWELSLAAYNAGPSRVARWDIPEETIDYIVDIKNMMNEGLR